MSETRERINRALAGRYQIGDVLGHGGMATVYRAHDVRHDRSVAVKVIRPEVATAIGSERFLQEIKLTARLQHPNILPLHDSGDADGHLFYVMPHVEGGTLRDKMSRERQLGLSESVSIAVAVARALDHAHQHQVVHRDIKPANILLHHGVPMVADFGIAHSAVRDERMTEPGVMVGTPHYMSPEQASGERALDRRSDVYALACVLYEMLTGEPPFMGASARTVMTKRLTDAPPSPRRLRDTVPEALDRTIVRAMARAAADRFATAAAFADALAASTDPTPPPTGTAAATVQAASPASPAVEQDIRFCLSKEGARIAYAVAGEGPPLIKAANWLSHLEHDWESPVWRHWLTGLARHNTFIRYDERGCGLSDWDTENLDFETWVSDLEAVVDAAGHDRFALLGVSQGGSIAVTYAIRHPERVSHLILMGAYARGQRLRGKDKWEEAELWKNLVKLGWGRENPAFRRVFSETFFPGGTPEQIESFTDLQRVSTSAENAIRIMEVFHSVDVRDIARQVQAPTLVLHAKGEQRIPFDEGRLFASLIPHARFVPLDSENHLPLEHEPAWQVFLDEVHAFLGVGDTRG